MKSNQKSIKTGLKDTKLIVTVDRLIVCEIFIRSIERFSLKYTTFVGDADTGWYGKVRDRCYEIFGESYKVIKEECVGHVQKRMGSGLREFKRKHRGMKLSDNTVVGGKGRLTDQVIDKIQNYYGEANRTNAGNIELMETAILGNFPPYDKER